MRWILAVSLVLAVGCGDDGNTKKDAGPQDAGIDAPADASCFNNPQTHNEIINACTTAQKLPVTYKPPLQKADGSLPPLP